MNPKRFSYTGSSADKTKADAIVDYVEGRSKNLKGFRKRLVLSPLQIKQIRKTLSLTQDLFADVLHINVATVRGWEQGLRCPDGPATALMMLLPVHPQLAVWLTQLHKKAPARA